MAYIYSIPQSSPTSRCLLQEHQFSGQNVLERGSRDIFHNAWSSNVFDISNSPAQLNIPSWPAAFYILQSHLLLLSGSFSNIGRHFYNISILPYKPFLLIRFTFRWIEIQIIPTTCKFSSPKFRLSASIAHAHNLTKEFWQACPRFSSDISVSF